MVDSSVSPVQSSTHDPDAIHVARRGWWLGAGAGLLALLSGIATSLILTGLTRIVPTDEVVVLVIFLNIVLMLPLVCVIGFQFYTLWKARQRNAAGSRLHIRVVALFSVIALLPAILLAAFAALSLNRALDQVFSKRVKSIVSNSQTVARAYVDEHANVLRGDTVAMARDLDAVAELHATDPEKFRSQLSTQAGLRDLAQAYLIDGKGQVLAATDRAKVEGYLVPPGAALADARAGGIVVIAPGRTGNRVAAIQRLSKLPETYLYVLRPVDAQVLEYLAQTEEGVRQYSGLDQVQKGIKIASAIMYVVIALTLLLISIWLGLSFANRLIAPIRRLIAAAKKIAEGDLSVHVPVRGAESDLRQLARTFNKMSDELKTQRDELVATNSLLVERRRFMEAMLSGVSAGVLGLDREGRVTLANRSAEALLGRSEEQLVGRKLIDVVPELGALLTEAIDGGQRNRTQQRQIGLLVDGEERTFAARITQEQSGADEGGSVLTFDDISELVTAQRSSAWADIARRIAHEIKNPLTPIQLSAERLKRKYGSVIVEDREVFDKCVSTIVRQVGDIGRMVDEFSSFARMPKPQMELLDMRKVLREAIALYELGASDIDVVIETPPTPVTTLCDRRLISQAMTNLVKNATEAIGAVAEQPDRPPNYRGRVVVRLTSTADNLEIEVIDNGTGLPKHNRGRLTEPYVTTRAKGTGLGLAIVQKITEQHGGTLTLEDAPSIDGTPARGALVRMRLKRLQALAVDDARTAPELATASPAHGTAA